MAAITSCITLKLIIYFWAGGAYALLPEMFRGAHSLLPEMFRGAHTLLPEMFLKGRHTLLPEMLKEGGPLSSSRNV